MAQAMWEAQLSSIIERTNANLTKLRSGRGQRKRERCPSDAFIASTGTNDSVERPLEKEATGGKSWESLGKANGKEVATLIDEEKLFERLASRLQLEANHTAESAMQQSDEDRLRTLEEEVSEVKSRATQAVTTARSHESTVEALSRESQARRGTVAKILAWQADTEAWRTRVEGELRKARGGHNVESNFTRFLEHNGGFSSLLEDSSLATEKPSVLPSQQHVHKDLVGFRKEPASQSAKIAGTNFGEHRVACLIQSCVTSTLHKLAEEIERRLVSYIGERLAAKLSSFDSLSNDLLESCLSLNGLEQQDYCESLLDGERDYPRDGDDVGASIEQTTMQTASVSIVFNREMSHLLARVEEVRGELASLRLRLTDFEEARRLESSARARMIEEMHEALDGKIESVANQIVRATVTAEDGTADTARRFDSARTEIYEEFGILHSEWHDEAVEIRRSLAKHEKQISKFSEKLGIVKISVRAYADDAPGVRRAGVLSAKFDKVEAKLAGIDDTVRRLRDAEDRAVRERDRLESLERWRDQVEVGVPVCSTFSYRGPLQAPANQQRQLMHLRSQLLQSDKTQSQQQGGSTQQSNESGETMMEVRLKTLESQYAVLRATLTELIPSKLREEVEARYRELAKQTEEFTADVRKVRADVEAKLSEFRDAFSAEVAALSASVSDCHLTSRRSADDAARAFVEVKDILSMVNSTGATVPAHLTTASRSSPGADSKSDARLAALEDAIQHFVHFQHPGGKDPEARDRIRLLERRVTENLQRDFANEQIICELRRRIDDFILLDRSRPCNAAHQPVPCDPPLSCSLPPSPQTNNRATESTSKVKSLTSKREDYDDAYGSDDDVDDDNEEAEKALDRMVAIYDKSRGVGHYLSRFRSRLAKSPTAITP